MFAWLVTIVLLESPSKVGIANMALLLPSTLLTLFGGSLADRLGARRIAILAQALAVIPPLYLVAALQFQFLDFRAMLAYAIAIGTLQAFITPARDGLLNAVADGDVQRTVVKTTLVQFSAQVAAVSIAGTAQIIGGVPILLAQAIVLATGVYAFWQIPATLETRREQQTSPVRDIVHSIVEGGRNVMQNKPMRAVMIQNIGIGVCFMGSYIVTVPLLIREVYSGSSAEIAFATVMNSLGLITTIATMLAFRAIKRPGRATIMASGAGALVLFFAGFGLDFPYFCVLMFFWGMCGGVGVSMSRSVMQEAAPEDQRGQVMAFFTLSFMGSGPIGALIAGFLSDWLGPSATVMIVCVFMLTISFTLAFRSVIWNIKNVSGNYELSPDSSRFI